MESESFSKLDPYYKKLEVLFKKVERVQNCFFYKVAVISLLLLKMEVTAKVWALDHPVKMTLRPKSLFSSRQTLHSIECSVDHLCKNGGWIMINMVEKHWRLGKYTT
jgi:hypothetical protein